MKHLALALLLALLPALAFAQGGSTPNQQSAARLDASLQSVDNSTSAQTSTLTPNAGESVYIFEVDITSCSDATGATAAAVTTITTTNILGSPAWTVGSGSTTAGALGGPGLCQPEMTISYPTGLRSATPGTAVTFVMPTFATHQTIKVHVNWRSAPTY